MFHYQFLSLKCTTAIDLSLITEMSVSKGKIKIQPAAKTSQVGIGMSFGISLGQKNTGLGMWLTLSADNSRED